METLKNMEDAILVNPQTKEEIEMKSLWKDTQCVILFLRRFGCAFCRLGAKELSLIVPQLKEANVRVVGIGHEELGVQDFIDGKYLDGELYLDLGKKSYSAMKFHKYNYVTIVPTLIAKVARDAYKKSKSLGIKGNLEGDGFQTGGLIVVDKNGEKILFEFRQNNPADNPSNEDILKALNLDATNVPKLEAKETADMQCDEEDACSKPT
ncbi:UNVERIFIED_CONTAM: hypothetical protein RMT77_003857 [Armadillidium vulgare]|nr:Prostamide/prostaglandin F synthase [Armadillidium vulgare]